MNRCQLNISATARFNFSQRFICARAGATSVNGSPSVGEVVMAADSSASESEQPRYLIHEIPQSQWPEGIPAVMGAHLMASGTVAPISTSKGPGDGNVPHVFQYHASETDTAVIQHGTSEAAAHGMAAMVQAAAASAISEKGSFTLVLSGGSLLKALSNLTNISGTDFSKWWIFFVDERNVPHSSDDSTYKGAKLNFLDSAGIPNIQIVEIHENLAVKEAAKNYEGRLLDVPKDVLPRNEEGLPVFDCMLLGTGPDGHIASLFPNSSELAEKDAWILPVSNSPKPPPERITMTLPVINACKQAIFLATGAGKSEVVRRVLECQALPGALPAQLVRPTTGKVVWLLDTESSAELQIAQWEDRKAYPRSEI